jgi:hypothetical protein
MYNSDCLMYIMNNLELSEKQIQQELDELIEGGAEREKSPQGTKTKKSFVQKTKGEINKLSQHESKASRSRCNVH